VADLTLMRRTGKGARVAFAAACLLSAAALLQTLPAALAPRAAAQVPGLWASV